MKLYRLLGLLSVVVTVSGALLSTSRLAQATTNPNCPAIPAWHVKPMPACEDTVTQGPLAWCAGSYTGGGCCIYNKYKVYCVSNNPQTNGKLISILYTNIAYSPGTTCTTSLDGTGECSIPTEIAP